MTVDVTDLLSFSVRACTPWCEVGDGHGDAHPEDRSCWSRYNVVPLMRHRPLTSGDGSWWRAFLNVCLRRLPEDNEPLVYVHNEETDQEIRLTLNEAEQLRNVLTTLLETANKP